MLTFYNGLSHRQLSKSVLETLPVCESYISVTLFLNPYMNLLIHQHNLAIYKYFRFWRIGV